MSFSSTSIIYNPKSTGTSKRNALDLQQRLKRDPTITAEVQVIPTKHAGHAEELAYQHAKASPYPLVISASGDGGYNEVVNGVMRARAEGAKAVTGLLPSGNANDHYHSVRSGLAEKLIAAGQPRNIDLLQVTVTSATDAWQRYAHSYAGIGLTAAASIRYNRNRLNPLSEWVISFQEITRLRPSKVIVAGSEQRYDSLILCNINRIGKLFFVSELSKIDDGKFEVVALQSTTKLDLFRHLAKAMTNRSGHWEQTTQFSFTTIEPQSMQMDGEIHTVPANATVTITCAARILPCIL